MEFRHMGLRYITYIAIRTIVPLILKIPNQNDSCHQPLWYHHRDKCLVVGTTTPIPHTSVATIRFWVFDMWWRETEKNGFNMRGSETEYTTHWVKWHLGSTDPWLREPDGRGLRTNRAPISADNLPKTEKNTENDIWNYRYTHFQHVVGDQWSVCIRPFSFIKSLYGIKYS